ncbi:hypothetical protein CPR19081_DFPECDIO_01042 [Companilactobacillus paralimentarius]|uniref:Arm DNA-binding domain-containing protein n=1 Tax=Companilactobacillus paralimentarius TaxID=83526 RepID=UPI00384C8B30
MATIHKRNGKWEYRVSYKDPTTGKYRNKTKGGFVRKTECEEAALMYLKSSKLVRKNTSIELITLILTIMFLEADVKKLLLLNQSISN